MVSQVGPGREAFIALLAGKRLFLGVDATVADERRGHPEGLAAVGTLVALGLGVDTAVVLEGHQVGKLLPAGAAEIGSSLVTVLVVEQGAGMAIRPATLIADEAPGAAARTDWTPI